MMDISLSSSSIIQDIVRRNPDSFAFANTLGSAINNREFSEGYIDFTRNRPSEKAYLWSALSVAGNDLGEQLYLNVKNYVDNVSNVDTCKVQAIRSMMQQINMNYDMLKKVDYYPVEIRNLIDILSINKKYILSNQFIKDSFIEYLKTDGIISADDAKPHTTPGSGLSSVISSDLDHYVYDQTAFDGYMYKMYYDFIYDMLAMPYADGSMVYSHISAGDGYGQDSVYVDKYRQYKKQYNVDMQFDPEQILNDIELGNDSIENYSGTELSLINIAQTDRQAPLPNLAKDGRISQTTLRTTRYAFYKKQKLIEFANFVDNMYETSAMFGQVSAYQYDSNYFYIDHNKQDYVIDLSAAVLAGPPDVVINSQMIENTARILVNITNYINKIREMIRTQVRRVFMKGTNNLLTFTINEFLIDYVNNLKNRIDNLPDGDTEKAAFYEVYANLSAHAANNIDVVEYWDKTEYMNLSTDTTKYASNRSSANQRFFDKFFKHDLHTVNDPQYFTTNEINSFYLDDLGLKNIFQTNTQSEYNYGQLSTNFYGFLSALYDLGADTSFIDRDYGVPGIKLAGGTVTRQLHPDLLSAEAISSYFGKTVEKSGHIYEESMTLLDQKHDIENKLYDVLSAEYLSGVSSVYDETHPKLEDLSSRNDITRLALEKLISSDYSYYFVKSNCEYCYDQTGEYMFDYFSGNPVYSTAVNFAERYQAAYDWINEYTHHQNRPLYHICDTLVLAYNKISSDVKDNVIDNITGKGYQDISTPDLATKMEDVTKYLNGLVDTRSSYLASALENFRQQANELKSSNDSMVNTLNAVLAGLPDTSQGYYYYFDPVNGTYKSQTNGSTAPDIEYDQYSGTFFLSATSNNYYSRGTFSELTATSIPGRLSDVRTILGQLGKVYFGSHPAFSVAASREPLDSIDKDYVKLCNSLDTLIDSVAGLFGLSGETDLMKLKSTSQSDIRDIEYKIADLISYLGTRISSQQYMNDQEYSDLVSYQAKMKSLQIEYSPAEKNYSAIWTDMQAYMAEFQKIKDVSLYTLDNIADIKAYAISLDEKLIDRINKDLVSLKTEYTQYCQELADICNGKLSLYVNYQLQPVVYSGEELESAILSIEQMMISDIAQRIYIGEKKIQTDIDYFDYICGAVMQLYYKYLESNVGSFSNQTKFEAAFQELTISWMEAIEQLCEKLDYRKDPQYTNINTAFKAYSGLSSASDPYYNHKNITHPSYQTHPFLWNFIKYTSTADSLRSIGTLFTNIDYDDLEGQAVKDKLDEYIGRFGQSIDVWRHNVRDFSGYATRYETSNHICEKTNLSSEVVAYDGAFYPPALDAYIAGSGYSDISAYYSHLLVQKSEQAESMLASALNDAAIRNKIIRTTALYDSCGVYDIFKYNLDSDQNAFILYKKYDKEDPSQYEKVNTPGEIWIRLADSPIALPLSCVISESRSTTFLNRITIYDFEISPAGDKITLAFKVNGKSSFIYTQAFYLEYEIIESTGVGRIVITDIEENDSAGNITQTKMFPSFADIIDDKRKSFKSYFGMYSRKDQIVDVLYIEHMGDEDVDNGIPSDPILYRYSVNDQIVHVSHATQYQLPVSEIKQSLHPVFSYYVDTNEQEHLDVAFVTYKTLSNIKTYKNREVDLSSNTSGYIYEDITQSDMNSHDTLAEDIKVITINYGSESGSDIKGSYYNINADIGYIPAYPGVDAVKQLSVGSELTENYQSVELLGRAKDIDGLISSVNENPDPYIDADTILSNGLFGRVYEEFNISADKTLTIQSNKSLYPNMPSSTSFEYHDSGKYYLWRINLSKYSDAEAKSLKVIIYNTGTLGRSPYLITDLSNAIQENLSAHEFVELSTNYTEELGNVNSDVTVNVGPNTYVFSGTCNGIDEVNGYSNKMIRNIRDVTYRYVSSSTYKALEVNLYIDNPGYITFVPEDTVKVALFNVNDFRIFEAYHFMDQHGFVKRANPGQPDEYSYIELSDGTEQRLDDINLSDFMDGTEIYALATNKRLQFKYGEEDIFQVSSLNYYFPSINVKFPYTMGRYYSDFFNRNFAAGKLNSYVNMYQDNEVYVINPQEPNVISNITSAEIYSSTTDLDVFRVYEDYFDVDEYGQQNSDKYSYNDPQFYQYVRFANQNPVTSASISVPEQYTKAISVNISADTDEFSKWASQYSGFGLFALSGEQSLGDDHVKVMFDFESLPEKQRDDMINGIAKFLRLYISYKKGLDGIELYVNYQNYVNTPFIKLNDNKIYTDIIKETYVKIAPGEDKFINAVVQMKCYRNGTLFGYRNIVIGRYQIFNVSDNKPKFIIKKVSELTPGTLKDEVRRYISVEAQSGDVQYSDEGPILYKVWFNSNTQVSSEVNATIIYPANLLTYNDQTAGVRFVSEACLNCTFTPSQQVIEIPFSVRDDKLPAAYNKMYTVAVVDPEYADDSVSLSSKNGYIRLIQ